MPEGNPGASRPVPARDVVVLHPEDPVAIALRDLPAGITLRLGAATVTVRVPIPAGHKVALRPIAAGELVRRYGQVIGEATCAIAAGEHVHTHNLGLPRSGNTGVHSAPLRQPAPLPKAERRAFLGYRRADGRVGTRNYVAVIAASNCAAHTVRRIAHRFTPERLAACGNVDGVIALAHPYGCGVQANTRDYVLLQRTLAGMATHPNVGGALLVGLGCEGNQVPAMIANTGLAAACPALRTLDIQQAGGIAGAVQAGVAAVEELLAGANCCARTPQPLSGLTVALQCGGSDGWSGVSANPIVGLVADELVRQGGTAVLAETPEMHGAEHLLISRAASPEVAGALADLLRCWQQELERVGMEPNANVGPGNRAGGLTTVYEKALGTVAKGGSTPLVAVYRYAERVDRAGLVFMDTPAYDPVSVTGQVAGGCNLVLFTTGRGSAFGCVPAPSIKVCSNSSTYERMPGDMDFNAGRALEGAGLGELAAELLELTVAVASGRPSKSEAQGVGECEFAPWQMGGLL